MRRLVVSDATGCFNCALSDSPEFSARACREDDCRKLGYDVVVRREGALFEGVEAVGVDEFPVNHQGT